MRELCDALFLYLLIRIKHPIILAGMNVAAGPRLAAAVTNAGGLGVVGGVCVIFCSDAFCKYTKRVRVSMQMGYTPNMMREQIQELKKDLVDKNAPFGIDLVCSKISCNMFTIARNSEEKRCLLYHSVGTRVDTLPITHSVIATSWWGQRAQDQQGLHQRQTP